MPSAIFKTGFQAANHISETLSAPRVLAILPLVLLCGFWIAGEPALVTAALAVPLLAAGSTRKIRVAKHDLPRTATSRILGRDEMLAWLGQALYEHRHTVGQTATVALVIDELDLLEQRFGRDAGHYVRNELLRRLQDALRNEDAVAGLADNLIVFGLQGVKPPETENLLRLARRIQAICDEPFTHQGSRIYCTVSLGIAAQVHLPDVSPKAMLNAAENAGDFAASAGPGSVRIFSEGLASERDDVRRHARMLSNAMETGEIFAWFQPQVSGSSNEVIGFEALARWRHPTDGVILPSGFLPNVNRAGMSQRLAEVILKQALTALNAWDAAGYHVPSVSVNFSGEDLRNPRLADYIMWELDRFNIAPGRLVIEVLESVIAEQHEDSITHTLEALSRAGCRIDLDDFGTGFTSIINIRRFNVSRIKIDRRLVSRVDQDLEQRRMVTALLSFSAKLGIEALAEGVENKHERDMLIKLGCANIQGYAVARPMPLGETFLWLDQIEAQARTLGTQGTAALA